jgi:hypothetical protein
VDVESSVAVGLTNRISVVAGVSSECLSVLGTAESSAGRLKLVSRTVGASSIRRQGLFM